jgi:ribosomal protein L32
MVVRMRSNRSHTGNRRSHHALKNIVVSKDAKGGVHVRHRASAVTGMYRGHQAVDMAKRLVRKEKKAKAASSANQK